jgi:succinate dehydrogenase / fumarate reductase iron-sulfur subunit
VDIQLKVRRQNPEGDQTPHWSEYTLDVPDHYTLLDALIQVREEVDETLSLRCSCRSHICGSCGMRINGHAGLACKTKIRELPRQITVEPMGNLPVIKDLVVDLEPFWNKLYSIDPFLKPAGDPPEREYVVPADTMLHLDGVINCIMCGACVSDCESLSVNPLFIGPTALAKEYRFVMDPRDAADRERLMQMNGPGGVWDCTHCYQCVEVCPKDVAPMERIMAMRRMMMDLGIQNHNGARRANAFVDLVGEYGRLDETRLLMRSLSGFGELLTYSRVGWRALWKGKLPPVRPHRLHSAATIRRIFERTRRQRPRRFKLYEAQQEGVKA